MGAVYSGGDPGISGPSNRRVIIPLLCHIHKGVGPGADGFGPVVAAPGAEPDPHPRRRLCGWSRHSAPVPAVAPRVYITIHILISADSAGVGGIALLRTGGRRDQLPIAMGQGRQRLGLLAAAPGTGIRLDPGAGAAGRLGHRPLVIGMAQSLHRLPLAMAAPGAGPHLHPWFCAGGRLFAYFRSVAVPQGRGHSVPVRILAEGAGIGRVPLLLTARRRHHRFILVGMGCWGPLGIQGVTFSHRHLGILGHRELHSALIQIPACKCIIQPHRLRQRAIGRPIGDGHRRGADRTAPGIQGHRHLPIQTFHLAGVRVQPVEHRPAPGGAVPPHSPLHHHRTAVR